MLFSSNSRGKSVQLLFKQCYFHQTHVGNQSSFYLSNALFINLWWENVWVGNVWGRNILTSLTTTINKKQKPMSDLLFENLRPKLTTYDEAPL